MTTLTRPVRRETTRTTDGGRQIIVTLEPGDLIRFRLKGCRKTFATTLHACYYMAVKAEVQAARQAKKAARS